MAQTKRIRVLIRIAADELRQFPYDTHIWITRKSLRANYRVGGKASVSLGEREKFYVRKTMKEVPPTGPFGRYVITMSADYPVRNRTVSYEVTVEFQTHQDAYESMGEAVKDTVNGVVPLPAKFVIFGITPFSREFKGRNKEAVLGIHIDYNGEERPDFEEAMRNSIEEALVGFQLIIRKQHRKKRNV